MFYFLNFFKFILCAWAFCVHGCLCPTCMQCHLVARRHQISQDWSNRCWSSWGAGNRNRSSGRAVNAPHHWATSFALSCFVCNWNCPLWSSSQWEARSLFYFMDFHGALFFYFEFLFYWKWFWYLEQFCVSFILYLFKSFIEKGGV